MMVTSFSSFDSCDPRKICKQGYQDLGVASESKIVQFKVQLAVNVLSFYVIIFINEIIFDYIRYIMKGDNYVESLAWIDFYVKS